MKSRRALSLVTVLAILQASHAPSAGARSILVVSGSDITSFADQLTADLTDLGHSVVQSEQVPFHLSGLGYHTVWFAGEDGDLGTGEIDRLARFLELGGGVHMTRHDFFGGDKPTVEVFVDTVVLGGGVDFDPHLTDGPYEFEPSAVGGVTTSPNEIFEWNPSRATEIVGLASTENVLVWAREFEGGLSPEIFPVGAVWDRDDLAGEGRLTLLTDARWFIRDGAPGDPIFGPSPTPRLAVLENLQTYLAPEFAIVPEPSTALLLGGGLLGLALRRRRTARRA